METKILDERQRFVDAFESGHWSMTELCERFGVSRPTGYKWVARFHRGGAAALQDESRAPATSPHRTSDRVARRILAARRQYGWGAKKLLQVLQTRSPTELWPARSTVNALLAREGLLRRHRRQRRWTHPGTAPLRTERPNQVWPADFKGEFKTGDGRYCYPLTVTDHFSRAVLVCHGLRSVRTAEAVPVFRALFREVGLPDAIRTDNGTPFASPALHGLSALNVWWMQLGIVHQRIAPSSPQQNGTHERMHRDLKRETTRPAAASLRAQQTRFDAFRRRYNQERPHDALDGQTPASRWTPSMRPYPARIAAPDYPASLEVRRVSSTGVFSLHDRSYFLSQVLQGQDVGLEEIEDGIWNIVFYRTLLGRLDTRTHLITGV
jgi:transposase InsO family protein